VSLCNWLRENVWRPTIRSGGRRIARPKRAVHPLLEVLEDRLCPSGGYLLVPDFDRNAVLRYNESTGAFVDEFVKRDSGGVNQPYIALYGPHDHNLYVSTGHWSGPGKIKAVLRYDGTTGAFLDQFVQAGHNNQAGAGGAGPSDPAELNMPHVPLFGPDGNLYIGDAVNVYTPGLNGQGRIARYNGTTGAYMDDFVPFFTGGLRHPDAMVFGPGSKGHLDLYVSDEGPSRIMRYDGTTGAFLGEFVPGATAEGCPPRKP
jgi:hypothetical protein